MGSHPNLSLSGLIPQRPSMEGGNNPSISVPPPLQRNQNEFVSLNSDEFRIENLKHCTDIPLKIPHDKGGNKLLRQFDNAVCGKVTDDNNILILDISSNGPALPSSFVISSLPSTLTRLLGSSKLGDASLPSPVQLLSSDINNHIHRIHLVLPSTLLRRPRFKFENMLLTTLTKEKIDNLMNVIDKCSTYIVFDEDSTFEKCSRRTHSLLTKFTDYISRKYPTAHKEFILLSPSKDGEELGLNGKDLKDATSKVQKFNLTVNIPSEASKKMFIQSIKKDAVHYSPTSLKRYFSFDIPDTLEVSDRSLPTWLKPFTERGKEFDILLLIMRQFELLETLENERLSKCLSDENARISSNSSKKRNGGAASSSLGKIYSLTHLQKRFKRQHRKWNYSQISLQKQMSSASISNSGNPSKGKEGEKTQNSSSKLKLQPLIVSSDDNSNCQEGSPCTDNSATSEPLLTPLDNYEVSQGICSFNKNRYSNILPYEHSRVKLHKSPMDLMNEDGPGYNSDTSSKKSSDGDSQTTFNFKRRRNSSCTSSFAKENGRNDTTTEEGNASSPTILESNIHQPNLPTAHNPHKFESGKIFKPKTDEDREQFNDYFNANYLSIPQINGDYKYVATQAPLPSTIDDFWNVIIFNKIRTIISLNSDNELEMRKWDIYWNNNDEREYMINVIETMKDICGLNGCTLRVFQVSKKNSRKYLLVYQLQYTKWLDSCSIDMESILQLFKIKDKLQDDPLRFLKQSELSTSLNIEKMTELHTSIDNYSVSQPKNEDSLILIHCSAGCGRTGVFITLDFLINILTPTKNKSNRVDVWNMKTDFIFIIVNELRKQRLSMVQNLSQYITCYQSILKYFALLKDDQMHNNTSNI
ncbi:protein-tyrosine phosphatase KNAG_0J01410 [Huiozyma naganishii CBS 8797]|uniref:Tyrosine specific protein phosphatases domain-containing protein n=1 Tax=Huiozyma naganishii (strain ATCC MYA-139 / BCRC 22969 / CBS 8797 / KCTC 17520 / NBRC 10181 / NCYC 3082 / Yp74L-3) TaxID=1071383 RepID=J7S2T0_HUIN7|nr:hypothetical protein KNAG_0J01410 [Kazachstania naganishii CBS 8797]CCK72222.1 hypothetical protein KNAG_0J01410 [Kazachstania naganishii CBS 8797]